MAEVIIHHPEVIQNQAVDPQCGSSGDIEKEKEEIRKGFTASSEFDHIENPKHRFYASELGRKLFGSYSVIATPNEEYVINEHREIIDDLRSKAAFAKVYVPTEISEDAARIKTHIFKKEGVLFDASRGNS